MTSTTDTDWHPEVVEISALTEGLLPPDRTADVREHLENCVLCAEVQRSLDEIRGLLGTLPGPIQMPAEIAERIDAALAVEALLDTTALSPVSRETAHPPWTPIPANRPPGRSRRATGPGRRPRIRRHWHTTALGAACAIATLGIGVFISQSLDSSVKTETEKESVASGPTFSGEDLETHVHALLADATPSPSEDVGTDPGPNTPLLDRSAISVPSCVQEGTGRPNDAPLAAKPGTYKGTAAYLVLLPHSYNQKLVDVYIIDSSCISKTPSPPGGVLLTETYNRG